MAWRPSGSKHLSSSTKNLEGDPMKGKIAILSFDRWSEQFDRRTLDKARWLEDWGLEVHLFCISSSGQDESFVLPGGPVRVHVVDWSSGVTGHHLLSTQIRAHLRTFLSNFPKLEKRVKWLVGTFASQSAVYVFPSRLYAKVSNFAPDIVICEDIPALIALQRLPISRTKTVLDNHELYSEISSLPPKHRAFLRNQYRTLMPSVDLLLSTSPATEDFILKTLGAVPRATAIYTNCPAPTPSLPIQRAVDVFREDIVAFVGNLTHERNIDTLIRAFGEESLANTRLILLGECQMPLKRKLKKIASPNVTFLDPIPSENLQAFLDGVTRIIIPYLPVGKNMELCFPNKLGDAIEWGIPVIASHGLINIENIFERHGVGAQVDFKSAASAATGIADDIFNSVYREANFSSARKELGWKANKRILKSAIAQIMND